jgi:hypothetical protein
VPTDDFHLDAFDHRAHLVSALPHAHHGPPPEAHGPTSRWAGHRVDHLFRLAEDGLALPVLVGYGTDDEVALLAPDTDGVGLRGLRVTDDTVGLGLVASGRARRSDSPDDERPQPVVVALVVHRDGTAASRVEPVGVVDHVPAGPLLDECRRALGLPTDPPPQGTEAVLTTTWLLQLTRLVARRPPGRLTWRTLVACHPVARLPTGCTDHRGHPLRTGDLVDLGDAADLAERTEALALERDWSWLRRQVAASRMLVTGVSPADAAWFDDGSFARAVLAELPAPALLDHLDRALTPGLARRVRAVAEPQLHPWWASRPGVRQDER